jgi:acyl carrier protein
MEARLRKVIAAVLGVDAAAVTPEASPATLKSWDSLRQMQIMLALEEEFQVRFDDDQIHELASFQLIAAELARRGISA